MEAGMRFAKIVSWITRIWGALVVTPFYFMAVLYDGKCSSRKDDVGPVSVHPAEFIFVDAGGDSIFGHHDESKSSGHG
jgi:hypothetical protein